MVAHRGASAAWPEHTPAAFAAAIADGADAVECDVRLSSDGHLVCVHDSRVERTSDGAGRVSSMTLAQLRALDWGSATVAGPSPPADPSGLLTLAELVALLLAAPRPVGLLVETKHPVRAGSRVEQAVAGVLAPLVGRLPVLAMMSFWPRALRRAALLAPTVPRVALRGRHLVPPLWPGLWGQVDVLGMSIETLRARPDAVAAARRAGRGVYVWTVEEPDDVARCVAAGVDAIITDRPREVRGMLAR